MTKSLQLLEGRIEDLRVVRGEQDILSGSQRLQGTTVAAALAASGLAGSAIGSAATLTGSDSVEYFFCRIDEKPIAGGYMLLKDDDLQNWCEKCTFRKEKAHQTRGGKMATDHFSTAIKELEEFDKATQTVGIGGRA